MFAVSNALPQQGMKRAARLAFGVGILVLVSACASHRERTLPPWGGDVPPQTSAPVVTVAPPSVVSAPPSAYTSRPTFTQGCTGNFSVRDSRTNREISSGRAYNSGQGLIVIDRAGRQVRALSSMGANTSVLFLPDCTCTGAGANQTSAVAPTTATCNGG
jgi:hypothetical protein